LAQKENQLFVPVLVQQFDEEGRGITLSSRGGMILETSTKGRLLAAGSKDFTISPAHLPEYCR